ncbi:MAG: Eco57I restriction-modification methylase domain-containing protein [Solirubrobacterales bacterium]
MEPSAGDGAFVEGLAAFSALSDRVSELVAIEPNELEARKCQGALAQTPLAGDVAIDSAVRWSARSDDEFDIAVGNPPFVRYQFVNNGDKANIARLGERLDVSFAGVSNLWIPVLMGALSRLRPGGVFAFVVPTELLTGLAASRLRQWGATEFEQVRLDLFDPGSFPEVLQEVGVFSGRRVCERLSATHTLTISEHDREGAEQRWDHEVDSEQPNWTRYLLSRYQLQALDEALAAEAVQPLGDLARFQVSIVTGANDFFSISEEDRQAFELDAWARPLLPRIRHAPGLIYDAEDQAKALEAGGRTWLLDFSELAEDPMDYERAAEYLRSGEKRRLHKRYKCRIRKPWYRVPHFERGSLMLSKRSHRFPRVIVNEAAAYTTDTIYRGEPLKESGASARAISASFHSSLTLLTAELEGRSFGGGVLELVPSEIERLALAFTSDAADWIDDLDSALRAEDEETLIEETDALVGRAGMLDAKLLETLSGARLELLDRRLARNRRSVPPPEELEELQAA